MQTLKREELIVGMRIRFVDRTLNRHAAAYVHTDRASVPLDGAEGVVVHINSRIDHDATCASKVKIVTVKGKHWEGEGDDRKEVAHELKEHAACDCDFRPGQPVAIALKTPHEKAHTCDGYVPMSTEITTVGDDGKSTTKTLYHGVWARPGHLYTVDAHKTHMTMAATAAKAHAISDVAKAKAIDIAKAYLADDGARTVVASQNDAQIITPADVGVVPADVKPKARR